MFKKTHASPYAIDYIAAITVVLIQVLIFHFSNDYSKFIFNFIDDTFGTIRFVFIIPLVAVITYSLYFGNSKLSFIVGFLSTITPQVYFILFLGGLDFILEFPQSFIAMFVLGVIFGLIGMLFSIFKKNADIATRISMHAAVLINILGIPAVLSGLGLVYISQILIFWSVFNSALILELILSYLILRDVKKAFIFSVSALIMTFLIIIITPLGAIYAPYPPIVYLFFGIIIAIILGVILKVYTYYREHKTRS